MKYCKFDGFTYPDSVINCRACGGSLLDIPSNQDSPDQLASSVSASECPNPECEITFARTDQTRFCPGCGIHLEPTSVNLVDVYGTPQGVPERALSDTTQAAELIEKPKWRGRSRKNAGQAPERDIARVEESSANAVDKSTTVQSRPEVPACPHCGMMMRKPGDPFCGNCGRMFNGSGNSPGFSPTKGVNESPQPIESLTLPTQETHALPIKLILGVVGGVALLLLIISGLSVSGNSVEQKLDKAIAAGSIFGPSNENAHDLYYQLINSGANEETLKRYREKLTPLLTKQGYRLTTDILIFGYDEPESTEWQEAGRSLDWAVELNPGNSYMSARAAYCNGRAAFVQKQSEQAVVMWSKAANSDKSWALPVNGIGLIYNSKREYSSARSYFSDAINREPNWAVPYENMGNAYYMEKNRDRAIEFYAKAAGKAPDWAKPHVHLADMALEEKDYPTAISEFELALSSNAKGLKSQEINRVQERLEIARQRLSE